MSKMKPKTQAIPPTLTWTDPPPLQDVRALEWLAGRGDGDDLHNLEGVALEVDAVLLHRRTFRPEICVRVGERWYKLFDIDPGDSGLEALRPSFVKRGPSPSEVERTRQREEAERESREQMAAHQEARAQHHRALAERARAAGVSTNPQQ